MKKKILITFIFLILVFLLIIFVVVGGRKPLPSPTPQESAISPRAFTILSLKPTDSTKYLGDTFPVEVVIDTGGNVVSGVELYLSFESEKLKVERVEPGSFFENPNILLNETDQEEGKISFALGTFLPKEGVGSLATLIFRVIGITSENQPTIVSFMDKTKVAEVGETESVLAKMEEAKCILLSKTEQ